MSMLRAQHQPAAVSTLEGLEQAVRDVLPLWIIDEVNVKEYVDPPLSQPSPRGHSYSVRVMVKACELILDVWGGGACVHLQNLLSSELRPKLMAGIGLIVEVSTSRA